MECQSLFSWKNKKNIISLSFAIFVQRVMKVKGGGLLLYMCLLSPTRAQETEICQSVPSFSVTFMETAQGFSVAFTEFAQRMILVHLFSMKIVEKFLYCNFQMQMLLFLLT